MTSIGTGAFSYCQALTSIEIPDGVLSIGKTAFYSCVKLSSIEIGNGVTGIGEAAFNACTALKSIVIPDSVTSIERYAFDGCSALTDVYYTGTAEQWNAIGIDYANDVLKSVAVHYNYDKSQAATGISLDKTSITVNIGGKTQLKATVKPETATNKNVTWKVGDTGIVQVSSDGTVTALAYGKTTVTAVTEDGGYTASCTVQTRFYDVTESQVASGAITSGEFERTYWAADMGIVKGKKDTNGTPYFDRVGNTTRAQMAVMLYRLAKIIDPSSAAKALEKGKLSTKFTDLDGISQGAVEGIYWAVGAGITKGYTESNGTVTYRPNNSISRASTIVMLYRMAGKPTVTAADTGFTDVDGILDRSSDTYKAIAWAKTTGITKGVNQANKTVIFDRVSNIQRRQMVTFINRYYQKINE